MILDYFLYKRPTVLGLLYASAVGFGGISAYTALLIAVGLGPLSAVSALPLIVVIFAGPVIEEVFCRMVIMRSLLLVLPVALAIFIQAYVFMLFHGSFLDLPRLTLGLLIGWQYYAGGFFSGLLTHITWNIGVVLWSAQL